MTDLLYFGGSVLISVFLCLFVRWSFQPYDYLKDLTDIGYRHIRGVRPTKKSLATEISRVRQARDNGSKLPPPFPNGWYFVIDSNDLKDGEAVSVDIIGQNLVVFRSGKGEATVFDAYCPHLGANLGVGGKVKGDCLECPFHEWQFRASDGECVSIPYSTTIPKSAKLKKWITCEVNKAIFVWYHVDGVEPLWAVPAVPKIDDGEWLYNGKSEFVINSHIQSIPENAADVAHLNAIHSPNMFTGNDIRYSRPFWGSFATHTWELKYEPCPEEDRKHIAQMNLRHSFKFFNKFEMLTMNVSVQQVGPAYVMLFLKSAIGEFVILQTVVPVEPLVQRVLHRFYFPRWRCLFAKFVIWGESVMFERDMMVWNHQRFVDNPLLLKEEKTIRSFRTWYSQFYSENSRKFAKVRDTLEW